MSKRTLFFFAILLCAINYSFCQTNQNTGDVQIIDFGQSASTFVPSNYNGQIIKTSPTSFMAGTLRFEYEKEVKDFLSLQIGIGTTFRSFINLNEDYSEILSELGVILDDCGTSDYDEFLDNVCDKYYDYTYRKAKPGMLLSFSPKFFYDSDGFDGGYFAPVIRYSKFNYDVQQIEEGSRELERIDGSQFSEYERNLDLMVQWGWQALHPSLTSEFFIGFGIRKQKTLRQDIRLENRTYYVQTERIYQKSRLRFELGWRLGFQLKDK